MRLVTSKEFTFEIHSMFTHMRTHACTCTCAYTLARINKQMEARLMGLNVDVARDQ